MAMYNLIEHNDTYQKTLGSFWQYYSDEAVICKNRNITDFPNDNNNRISFKFKEEITGETGNNGTKDVEITVPLKYLSNFWRTLEIPSEINLMLTW